jgi:dipeptide transport system substrate-binding protein
VSAGWAGDNGDPDNFLTPLLSCEAAKTAKTTPAGATEIPGTDRPAPAKDRQRRTRKLYSEALEVYDEDQPWISMAHPKMFTAMRDNVEGYVISPLTNNNFATTKVK